MYSPAKEWDEYLGSFPSRNEDFVRLGYITGTLPDDLTDELREAILGASPVPFTNDVVEGAQAAALSDEELRILNAQHVYRELDRRTAFVLTAVFASMRDAIARALNSPWRVLTARSWTTDGKADFGPNAWHVDGDHPELLKAMIYSSGNGGLHLKHDEGETIVCGAGLWAVFYNSKILHRGFAFDGIRVATEVTIAPSREFDLRPISLGLAARHMVLP